MQAGDIGRVRRSALALFQNFSQLFKNITHGFVSFSLLAVAGD
jgi:hypothetical protein